MNTVFRIVLPILFVVIGSLVAVIGLYAKRLGGRSRDWPKTKGKVVRSWIAESSISRSNSGASGGGRGSSVIFYGPRIEYHYEVNGNKYSSRQISVVESRSINRLEVEKFLEDYPAGAEVDVYYNPGNPSQAYLIPGSNQKWWLFLLIGLVFAAIGILIFTGIINIPSIAM